MPFVAMVKQVDGNEFERVEIEDYESPRLTFLGCDIRCPACDATMHIRYSILDRPYFQHNADFGACDYAEKEAESLAHRAGKKALIYLLKTNRKYEGAKIVEEFTLKTLHRKRVADIYVQHSGGEIEIHEVQLAGISPEKLQERTSDYRTVENVHFVYWWLGNEADTERNREWCKSDCGKVLRVTTEDAPEDITFGPFVYSEDTFGSTDEDSEGSVVAHRSRNGGNTDIIRNGGNAEVIRNGGNGNHKL